MLPLGFASFLCFGVVLVLVGANQAGLARDLGLDLEQTGLLGSALAIGIGIGVVGAGPLFDRLPRRPVFVASTLLAAAALASVDASTGFARLMAHVLIAGIGIGAYDTLINATVVERYSEDSAKPMAAIHAAATIGAMVGPPLVSWFFSEDWSASFRWTGVSHLVLAAVAASVRFPAPPARDTAMTEARESVISWALLPFSGVAFAYVGIEAAMIVFAIPYAEHVGLPDEQGRLAISVFWLGLLAGRLAVLGRSGAPAERTLRVAGLLSAVLILGGITFAPERVELLFGLVGFSLGAVYPVVIALAGQRFPHARGSAAGFAAGAGALGGFAIPWITGALGDAIGISIAIASLAVWSLLIALSAATPRPGPHLDATRQPGKDGGQSGMA